MVAGRVALVGGCRSGSSVSGGDIGLLATASVEATPTLGLMAFNDTVEQLVRTGIGSPLPLPVSAGIVILETKGRVSGKPRNMPLLAQRIGNSLLVSTVRISSQWVRNLEADDAPRVVLNGKSRAVKAKVRRLGDWTVVRLDLV